MKKVKQLWAAGKAVLSQLQKLQASMQQLQSQLKKLTKTTDALQRSMRRYSFKNQPHLDKIDRLLKK